MWNATWETSYAERAKAAERLQVLSRGPDLQVNHLVLDLLERAILTGR